MIESAAHLNALDGINNDVSPVCPGQSIKEAIKKKKWSALDAPSIHLVPAESQKQPRKQKGAGNASGNAVPTLE